jgi:head-tail adaptor
MKQCSPIANKRRGVCSGNLTEYIKIFFPTLTAPDAGVDFSKPKTTIIETWAMIATTRGSELFDGSSLTNAYTHIFYIRNPGVSITSECWIEHNSLNFKIVDIENMEERGEFLTLRCSRKGDTSLAGNTI